MKKYNNRIWLNPPGSASTGTVVSFYGDILQHKKKIHWRYLEISDCHYKIKLHKTEEDSDQDFIDKLTVLRDEIDEFITFLKNVN